jgi:hypothetical protein
MRLVYLAYLDLLIAVREVPTTQFGDKFGYKFGDKLRSGTQSSGTTSSWTWVDLARMAG